MSERSTDFDGSIRSAVRLVTGMTDEQLDDLGMFDDQSANQAQNNDGDHDDPMDDMRRWGKHIAHD